MTASGTEHAFEQQTPARVIAGTIRELAEEGWLVAEPKSAKVDWLPESLRRFEPDLVAIRDNELMVVEVKSRNSGELADLDGLAKAVAELPGARLEVRWLGDVRQIPPASVAVLTGKSVSQTAAEARELLKGGHHAAAALIAWSAVEGALLRYAAELQVPLPAGANGATLPWRLLSELDSRGYISEGDLERLPNSAGSAMPQLISCNRTTRRTGRTSNTAWTSLTACWRPVRIG